MIGTRLRQIRVARGMTQVELASPRYTHAYVSAIEAGRRQPSTKAIEHFASGSDSEAQNVLVTEVFEALSQPERLTRWLRPMSKALYDRWMG